MKTIYSLSTMVRLQSEKLFFGTLLSALVLVCAIPTMAKAMAGGDVGIRVALPPPIVFAGPPEVVVIPETYVYAVPDVDVDIFFYDGWWWRPWEGRWYRSQHYNSGWAYYQSEPSFYAEIPRGWRNEYKDHRWGGHQWNHQRIPHQQLQQNWRGWERDRYWEKQQTWGVQGLQPRTRSQQPDRGAQPRQPQQQLREDRPDRSQPQYREGDPQYREGQPQQRRGNHERGDGEKEDRR